MDDDRPFDERTPPRATVENSVLDSHQQWHEEEQNELQEWRQHQQNQPPPPPPTPRKDLLEVVPEQPRPQIATSELGPPDETSVNRNYNPSEIFGMDDSLPPPPQQYRKSGSVSSLSSAPSSNDPVLPPSRQLLNRRSSWTGLDDNEKESPPPPNTRQGSKQRRRSQSHSLSPSRRPRGRSQNRSMSPGVNHPHRKETSAVVSVQASSNNNLEPEDDYLMFQEIGSSNQQKQQNGIPLNEAEERFEAHIAFSLQMAFVVFCCLIILVVIMAASLSRSGYFAVILVFLAILLGLALGLCWFLWYILTEDEKAPRVNQKHMPEWYKTVKKVIRQELSDFRDDWRAMCNNLLLLEDGGANNDDADDDSAAGDYERFRDEPAGEVSGGKPKKRRGKSTIFKLVAKPVAVLANFRRKRKEKKRNKKALAATGPRNFTFPSTV